MLKLTLNTKSKIYYFIAFVLIFNISHSSSENIEYLFQKNYNEWKDYVLSNDNPSSHIDIFIDNDCYKNIKDMGVSVLPYLVVKMKQEDRNLYGKCLWKTFVGLSKKKFDKIIVSKTIDNEKTMFYKWIRWWETERNNIFQEFQKLYINWKNTSEKERNYVLISIENLGIPALPYAIEKIKEGDADLIEAVNYWTDDALKKSAKERGIAADGMRDYCVEWWEANKEYWLLPPVEESEKK